MFETSEGLCVSSYLVCYYVIMTAETDCYRGRMINFFFFLQKTCSFYIQNEDEREMFHGSKTVVIP